MEVHKHPHHVTHKKKWTEYLLEFFMLFLAVFLGFVAENVRENSVERHREKEYMHDMVVDLQRDTSLLQKTKEFSEIILKATDSSLTILDNEKLNDSLTKLLYKHNLLVYRFAFTEFEDRTAAQLKNAGGLRLVRNQKVLDSLSNYWELQKKVLGVGENLQDKKDKMHELEYKIFYERKYYKRGKTPFEAEVIGNPVLSPQAQDLLPEYINRLNSVMGINRNYLNFLINQKRAAINTIKTIKEQYNFND